MNTLKLIVFFNFLLVLPLQRGEAHGCHHHQCNEAGHEEGFHWSKEKSDFADVHIKVAEAGIIKNFIHVPGKVAIHPDYQAYVIPKITGVVCSISKNVGDSVEKGERLALIESREIAETKVAYLNALKKVNMQRLILKQESGLRGISPKQDYLDAEWALEKAAMHLELAAQSLYALGFTEKEIARLALEPLSELRLYEIKAPLKGQVVERNLILGEQLDQSSKAFTIANFEKLRVEIHISQKDIPFLKAGLPIEVQDTSSGRQQWLKLAQWNPTLCEETRMATALGEIENSAAKWTPGEFVTVHIQAQTYQAPIIVSKEAIQNIKGIPYVFVAKEENFHPCPVKLGKQDEQYVEIISGIAVGDQYACGNAFCLKAELEKEEAEHSHSH